MDAEKNQEEVLGTTNQIEEAILTNNQIFSEKWELTHDQINHCLEEHLLLKTWATKLESPLGLQQTTLQHCQDTIAGLEEIVAQFVVLMKNLEKTVCRCHNWLLLPGPHYTPGEEEEIVEDLEEEDGLEYKTNVPLGDSYMTPPSTGGHSKPSPHPPHSPTLKGSNPITNTILQTTELEAHIELFLEEVEEDMELDDPPPLENITPLQVLVPNPIIPSFVPFTVSTGQCCVPPKSLLHKVYHPYHGSVGQFSCEPGGWCTDLPCSSQKRLVPQKV